MCPEWYKERTRSAQHGGAAHNLFTPLLRFSQHPPLSSAVRTNNVSINGTNKCSVIWNRLNNLSTSTEYGSVLKCVYVIINNKDNENFLMYVHFIKKRVWVGWASLCSQKATKLYSFTDTVLTCAIFCTSPLLWKRGNVTVKSDQSF